MLRIKAEITGRKSAKDLVHIRSNADAVGIMKPLFTNILVQEDMIAIYLNNNLAVLGWALIGRGNSKACTADVKMLATYAITHGATQVILGHNHPSGRVLPSKADDALTLKVHAALALLDILLIDHLIFTDSEVYSYEGNGSGVKQRKMKAK